MPEGDAVWRTARRLHEAFAGEVLTDWDVRWPTAATSDLRGSTTLEVVARGKHLLHRLDSGRTLHTHLRMEGSWRVRAKSDTRATSLRRPDLRVLLGTSTMWGLGQRLGRVDLVRTVEESRLVGHLGPDPLGRDWDPGSAVVNLRNRREATVGAALLDQEVLAGLGTMWVSEALFLERIHPQAQVRDLADETLVRVVEQAAAVLRSAITTRPRLYVHDRRRRPCPRCGATIGTTRVGEPPRDRQLHLCAGCQKRVGGGGGPGLAPRSE